MKGRPGYDALRRKPVVVVGEVAGVKLLSGKENKPIGASARKRLARNLLELCREHGIRPSGLGLSLTSLGFELLQGSVGAKPARRRG